jgi:hypothetical protein
MATAWHAGEGNTPGVGLHLAGAVQRNEPARKVAVCTSQPQQSDYAVHVLDVDTAELISTLETKDTEMEAPYRLGLRYPYAAVGHMDGSTTIYDMQSGS